MRKASGKTPRLFPPGETLWGLKCGLSGNPALLMATRQRCSEKETAVWRQAVNIWEILLDLKPQSLLIKLPPMSHLKNEYGEWQSILGDHKQRPKQPRRRTKKTKKRWVILVSLWTFFLAVTLTWVTRALLQNLRSVLISFILLILIIALGIFFDLVGTAVTAAEETPFHAKAAKKIYGAKKGIYLVRHADQVANFCNDVIGDISGIVSGVIGTVIVVNLVQKNARLDEILLSVLLAGAISALTVGGKARGKSLAIDRPTELILFVARFLTTVERIFRWRRNA